MPITDNIHETGVGYIVTIDRRAERFMVGGRDVTQIFQCHAAAQDFADWMPSFEGRKRVRKVRYTIEDFVKEDDDE